MRTAPAFEIDLERLWSDIVLYMQFLEMAAEEDPLWLEYVAWKKLTDKREAMRAAAA